MKNEFNIYNINKITFESGSEYITLEALICKDTLCYNTTLIIGSTDLNRIINRILLINPTIDVDQIFEKDQLNDGSVYYSFNFEVKNDINTAIHQIEFDAKLKQIRA